MTDRTKTIDAKELIGSLVFQAGATAYPPLPIDPIEAGAEMIGGPSPRPAPRPAPRPDGPAYPSLPIEPDTREGGQGGERR
jgi:hypothetical protein